MIKNNNNIIVGNPDIKLTKWSTSSVGGYSIFTADGNGLDVKEAPSISYTVGEEFGKQIVVLGDKLITTSPRAVDTTKLSLNTGAIYITDINVFNRRNLFNSQVIYSPLKKNDCNNFGSYITVKDNKAYVLANGSTGYVNKNRSVVLVYVKGFAGNLILERTIVVKHKVKSFTVENSNILCLVKNDDSVVAYNINTGKSYLVLSADDRHSDQMYVCNDNKLYNIMKFNGTTILERVYVVFHSAKEINVLTTFVIDGMIVEYIRKGGKFCINDLFINVYYDGKLHKDLIC